MSAIDEFQFELLPSLEAEGGEVFGIGANVSCDSEGFHPGSTDWATQDGQSPANGTTTFGRDILNGPLWSWDLHVNRDKVETAVESLEAFATAWRALAIRNTPSAVIPLRYQLAGRSRRIFGRPRGHDASPNNLILNGYVDFQADFKAVDGFTYDDQTTVVTLAMGGNVDDSASGGGMRLPARFPVAVRAVTSQVVNFTVSGTAPTYPVIRFNGPIVDPSLTTDDWRITFTGLQIDAGHWVEVDTRPWAMTILDSDGASAADKLGSRIILPDVVLQPGLLGATFRGTSSTGAATCVVSWRSAWNSI